MKVQEIVEQAEPVGEGSVSRSVQQVMLSAIADGKIGAGDALHDHEWAAAFGVSRTPVREAIQHLHGMGLLDVAAARYTRLRTYTPDEAAREARDWSLLHHALIEGVVDRVPEGLVDRLCRLRDLLVGQTHPEHVRTGNFAFFHALRAAVPSSAVTLGATAAAYRLRLAESVLPHDPTAHTALRDGIIHALTTRDRDHAHRTMTDWIPAPAPVAG